MQTCKNMCVCKYYMCVYTLVLSKKPTCVWFMSHMCDLHVLFKLWVIFTVYTDGTSPAITLISACTEQGKT